MRNCKPRLAALLTLGLALLPSPASADQAGNVVYQKTLHATAWIVTPKGRGTGWIVDRERKLLITNHHVVGDQTTVAVIFPLYQGGRVIPERGAYKNARQVRGRVLTTDPRRDLAAIVVDALPESATALTLAKEGVGPGDRIHSVGNPGASDALWVYTSGTVRQVYRRRMRYGSGQEVEARVIETQAPINPGDSGGPVVNDNGELVGVNASHLTGAQLVSYCIDVSEVRTFVSRARTFLASPEAKDALPYRQRAHALAVKEEYAKAVAEYTEAIRLNPRDPVAYRERGLAYRRMRELDKAIADYTEALRLDPKDAVAYNNRAAAYYTKGDFDKAIADTTEALRIEAKYPLAYMNRALAHVAKRDYDKAIADYTEAIRIDPKNAVAYRERAVAYRHKKELDKALEDGNEAIRLNPKDAVAYNNRAVVWRDRKELDKAIADCTKAIELQPRYTLAYKNRGLSYVDKGDYDKAIADFSEALRINPKDAQAYLLRSKAYGKKGDADKAEADAREAERLKAASGK